MLDLPLPEALIVEVLAQFARRELGDRLEKLGVPPTARLGYVSIPEGSDPVRQSVVIADPEPPWILPLDITECPTGRISLAGVLVDAVPERPTRPHFQLRPGLVLEVWLGTARVESGLATTEVSWAPTGHRVLIELRFGRWRDEDFASIGRATRFLETIHPPRGAPAMSDADAFELAVHCGLEWLADHPGQPPGAFSVTELAKKRVTEVSSTQWWLKTKHIGIRRVQREIARRISRPE